jgi:recombination protein RecA
VELDNFLSKLNPITRKRIKIANQIELKRCPLISVGLTQALGGGLAFGRQYLFYGNKSAGKSSILLQSVADWQKQGYICAWIDIESAFDPEWAKKLGVDVESLIVSQAKVSDELVSVVSDLMVNEVDFVVVDSITALIPMGWVQKNGELKELENTGGIGQQSLDLGRAVKLLNAVNKRTCLILISQIRNKITSYGAVGGPTGGNAVEFYSTASIKLYANKSDKEQIKKIIDKNGKTVEQNVGREVTYLIEYNKIGPPSKVGAYDFYYAGPEVGIDLVGEIISLAMSENIITTAGAWCYYKEMKFNGRTKTTEYFRGNTSELEDLKKELSGRII